MTVYSDTRTSLSDLLLLPHMYCLTVLVLTDRTVDLSVALHHAWTYQALLHDVLGMKANRIKLAVRDTCDCIASH